MRNGYISSYSLYEVALMRIPDFELERWKALYVTPGVTDLTETGLPSPLKFRDIFVEDVMDLRLDYAQIYGDEILRQRVAELYLGVEKDRVLVTSSTSEGNMIGVNMVVENGDEVLSVQPAFMQIPGLLEGIGVRIKEHYLTEENGFHLDPDKLNESMTKKCKVIALNFPNNPTGRVLSRRQVRAITEIAKDNDAWIVCDEVYRGIEFEGPFSPSFAEDYDKAVVASSLSKVWGLPGLRVGWMVAPKDVVTRGSAFKEVHDAWRLDPLRVPRREGARHGTREKLIARGRKLVRESFRVFRDWMRRHEGVLSWNEPEFGVISLVKHELRVSSNEFAARLLKQKKVAVVPCDTCFPKLGDSRRYLRISYCHPPEVLKPALAQIDDVIDEFVKAPRAHSGRWQRVTCPRRRAGRDQ